MVFATAATPPSSAIQQIVGRNGWDRDRSRSSNLRAADRAPDRQFRTSGKPDLFLPVQHTWRQSRTQTSTQSCVALAGFLWPSLKRPSSLLNEILVPEQKKIRLRFGCRRVD